MSEEKKYPIKKIVTIMQSTERPDGNFIVVYKIVQSRSLDGESWEAREASAEGYGKTIEKAFDQATTDILFYLNTVNGDLFSAEELVPWDKTTSKF